MALEWDHDGIKNVVNSDNDEHSHEWDKSKTFCRIWTPCKDVIITWFTHQEQERYVTGESVQFEISLIWLQNWASTGTFSRKRWVYLRHSWDFVRSTISHYDYLCVSENGVISTQSMNILRTWSGWWFGTFSIFPYIGLLIIPIDVHIFQRGGPTTNQWWLISRLWDDLILRPAKILEINATYLRVTSKIDVRLVLTGAFQHGPHLKP